MSHIDDMQALVVVEHAEGYYNLYLSDESGLFFSLSLRDIVVETLYRRWQIDLELVRVLLYSCTHIQSLYMAVHTVMSTQEVHTPAVWLLLQ